MSTRNTDSSALIERTRSKMAASFATTQGLLANPSTGSPIFLKTNPQTGNSNDSVVHENTPGEATQYTRAYGTGLVDPACHCGTHA